MKRFLLLCSTVCCLYGQAQDTFSILAFDSITGEVGGAGASCVDLFGTGLTNDFIIELFPGVGAIACQASYMQPNQVNARSRMFSGDSPTQLITWLQNNDAGGNASIRQYGVVRMDMGYPRAAAHTGGNCMNFKNHIVGANYTIQGNILLGQQVLDSMEAGFKRATGGLACKLMAALQGAKMVGADTRCAGNGTSSYFGFLKVCLPTDSFGVPSFIVSLKTHAGAGIEPIDSLQMMFDAARSCTVSTVGVKNTGVESSKIYPNPSSGCITIDSDGHGGYTVTNLLGQTVQEGSLRGKRCVINLPSGVYVIRIEVGGQLFTEKVVVN